MKEGAHDFDEDLAEVMRGIPTALTFSEHTLVHMIIASQTKLVTLRLIEAHGRMDRERIRWQGEVAKLYVVVGALVALVLALMIEHR